MAPDLFGTKCRFRGRQFYHRREGRVGAGGGGGGSGGEESSGAVGSRGGAADDARRAGPPTTGEPVSAQLRSAFFPCSTFGFRC